MNEAEWLESVDPARMLRYLTVTPHVRAHLERRAFPAGASNAGRLVSDRKLRLFACACCRQVWHLLTDDAPCPDCGDGGGPGMRATYDIGGSISGNESCDACSGTGRINRSRRAVEVAERYADGEATEKERDAVCLEAWRRTDGIRWVECKAEWMAWVASSDIQIASGWINNQELVLTPPATQAALLRDICGNPWRPWHVFGQNGPGDRELRYEWFTPTVLALARAAYEERPGRVCGCKGECYECSMCHGSGRIEDGTLNSDRLAVLADALEEAGCIGEDCPACRNPRVRRRVNIIPPYWCGECDPDTHKLPHPLLAHVRSPGPHVRGCWAVDLMLGREK